MFPANSASSQASRSGRKPTRGARKLLVTLLWPKSIDKFESDFIVARIFSRLSVVWGSAAAPREMIIEVTDCADGFGGTFVGKPYGQIQLSNEGLRPVRFPSHVPKLIFRNYFDPRYSPSRKIRTFTIPLGYKSEFFPSKPPKNGNERPFIWSFVGEKKGSREEIIKLFTGIGASFVHWTSSWNDPSALSASEVRETYEKTAFVICPWGYLNPDSFRLTEALESGAIPVTVKFCGLDYARTVFGPHPFIAAKNWREAATMVKRLCENPENIERKRKEVEGWYEGFLDGLSSDVESLLANPSVKVSKLRGQQWKSQIQSRHNPLARSAFFLYFRFWWFRKLMRPI